MSCAETARSPELLPGAGGSETIGKTSRPAPRRKPVPTTGVRLLHLRPCRTWQDRQMTAARSLILTGLVALWAGGGDFAASPAALGQTRTPTSLDVGAETAATLKARYPASVDDLRRIQDQLQQVLQRAV